MREISVYYDNLIFLTLTIAIYRNHNLFYSVSTTGISIITITAQSSVSSYWLTVLFSTGIKLRTTTNHFRSFNIPTNYKCEEF